MYIYTYKRIWHCRWFLVRGLLPVDIYTYTHAHTHININVHTYIYTCESIDVNIYKRN